MSEPTALERELAQAAGALEALDSDVPEAPRWSALASRLRARAARVAEAVANLREDKDAEHDEAKWWVRRLTGPLDTPSAAHETEPGKAPHDRARELVHPYMRCMMYHGKHGIPCDELTAKVAPLFAAPTRAAPPTSSVGPRHEADRLGERARTIADEAFGPFPVQSADEALSCIEQGIFDLRKELERARRQQIATAVGGGIGAHATGPDEAAEAKGADIEGTREGANLGPSEFAPSSVPAGGSTASPAKSACRNWNIKSLAEAVLCFCADCTGPSSVGPGKPVTCEYCDLPAEGVYIRGERSESVCDDCGSDLRRGDELTKRERERREG